MPPPPSSAKVITFSGITSGQQRLTGPAGTVSPFGGMVRDVGQRGKWGGTGRLTANFSLLATPDGAANGRRTNAVMPNGHHSLPMPPRGPIFPYSLRFPHHPTHFHTLSRAFLRGSAPARLFPSPTGAIRARFAPISVPAPLPNRSPGTPEGPFRSRA